MLSQQLYLYFKTIWTTQPLCHHDEILYHNSFTTATILKPLRCYKKFNTINDKSFESEKFHGLLGSSGMWGKVSQFFNHHLRTFMVFQLYKTATSISTKASRSSCEFSIKTVISILGNGQEQLHYKHMCEQISHFQDDHAVTGGEDLQLKMRQITTASLLAPSASYFLISWQKPSRYSSPLLWNTSSNISIFYGVNFQRSKTFARKTFAVH